MAQTETSDTKESEPKYFYRAKIADKATVVVGLAHAVSDVRSRTFELTADYVEDNSWLGVPNPRDILPISDVGMVSWPEHRRFRKLASSLPKVVGGCVVMEQMHEHSPFPAREQQQDFSLDRPLQGELFTQLEN